MTPPDEGSERQQRPVAVRLDHCAPVRFGGLPNRLVMPPHRLHPRLVTESRGEPAESTMSVKTSVTVPSAAALPERSGRSSWTAFSS